MLSADEKVLDLHEPEIALAWLQAFKVRFRAEKKVDVEANGGKPNDMKVKDHILFRCSVAGLMKLEPLVAPTEMETMPVTDIETVSKIYLQPRKRLVIAEQTKFVAITKKNGESLGDFLPRHREAGRYWFFGKLQAIGDPGAYLIQLRFIAGLENSEHKIKFPQHPQNKPEGTIDDILLVIQQREQTVQFITKQSAPTESVSFVLKGNRRKKND